MNRVGIFPTEKERDMKRTLILLAAGFAILGLSACTLRAPAPATPAIPLSTPTAPPATQVPTASAAPVQATPAPTQILPAATNNPAANTAIPGGVVSTAAPSTAGRATPGPHWWP